MTESQIMRRVLITRTARVCYISLQPIENQKASVKWLAGYGWVYILDKYRK